MSSRDDDRPKTSKKVLKAVFSAFLEFGGSTTAEGLWGTRAIPKSTARTALEELIRLGFVTKRAIRTGRRGRPPANYYLLGHPDEAEERFKAMLKQRRHFGTSEEEEQTEAQLTYNTRLRPLGRSTPEIHLGMALDYACPNTGTMGWFDAHPRNPRRFGKPDYGCKRLKMVLFADGSMWHGGKQYQKQKGTVNEKIKARVERQMERDKEVTKTWEDMGWKVVRYWEEELKDWRAIGERLSEEIWDRAEELGIMK